MRAFTPLSLREFPGDSLWGLNLKAMKLTQLHFATWNRLLRTYVDDQGRIAYGRWQQESLPELEQWLADMSSG